ncbi:MAG: hypothetical protein M1480_05385 [Bacteroidetes bacterium]|nr:hypothetical protein [Bacteroidota bacterium]
MNVYIKLLLILFFLPSIYLFAQDENLQWKLLIENDNQKIWYGESTLNTLQNYKFNVWILQMHKKPIEFQEVPEKIYRSKIQYALDLRTDKYGILKVVYYGINNKEIYNFDYHIGNYPDSIKYTYPISDVSYLKILKEKIIKEENKEPSISQ